MKDEEESPLPVMQKSVADADETTASIKPESGDENDTLSSPVEITSEESTQLSSPACSLHEFPEW